MLKPGTVLDDRYEILDIVGTGGMSTVYKAKDERLKRYVAVKVLKSDYSSDANFVSKFRVEAQASASLVHPNIVRVYDVCEDDGRYFIVMELVEGITLKQYIDLNGRLNMDQAIDFSLQIASALEEAHEHHVIHRDIKPQNIIVSKNGTIKVTDFGIAKAATSTTMSTTGIGSVHYISPEQARGGYSDERSDIYSLGITMYEMVTGRVPFEGDTNVAIALMHIQNEITPPRELYPDIYPSFEKIIMKCTQKKPERRYLTAAALIADLKRVKENPNIDIVVAPAGVPNAPTQRFTAEDMQKIKDRAGAKKIDPEEGQDPGGQETPRPQRTKPVTEDDDFFRDSDRQMKPAEKPSSGLKKVPDDEDYDDDPTEPEDEEEVDPKLEKAVKIGAIAAAVIIAVIIFVVIGNLAGLFHFGGSGRNTEDAAITAAEATSEETETSTEERTQKMIDVTGLTREAAEKQLQKAGFTNIKVDEEDSTDVPEGYVIRQNYDENKEIPVSTEIILTVSSGAAEVEVQDVTGRDVKEADQILKDLGFEVTHSYEDSDTVEEDAVIRQKPEGGTKADEGSVVTLVLSRGKEQETVEVPDLTGKTETDAKTAITGAGLTVGNVSYEYNSSVPAGQVIRQSISAGTETVENTSVDIVISNGPETVTYTGTVNGSVTTTNMDFLNTAPTVTVTVYIQDAAGQHVVYTGNAAGNAAGTVSVSGHQDGLKSDDGQVYFTVIDSAGNDVTSYYTNTLTLSYKED